MPITCNGGLELNFIQVYQQIETMAETLTPKSRRSKSISQQESILSRTSSPHADLSSVTPLARSRPSSEVQPTDLVRSRTSVEKLRRRDSPKAHQRSSSVKSEASRQADESYDSIEVKFSVYLSNKQSNVHRTRQCSVSSMI